ncbi:hypothetical protein B4Q13_20755 [Lacticaseibacillus rhamnosus]
MDEAAVALDDKFGNGFTRWIEQKLGMSSAKDAQAATQAEIDESRKLDAPLKATGGGKVGEIVGTAAVGLPATFVPVVCSAVIATSAISEPTAAAKKVTGMPAASKMRNIRQMPLFPSLPASEADLNSHTRLRDTVTLFQRHLLREGKTHRHRAENQDEKQNPEAEKSGH